MSFFGIKKMMTNPKKPTPQQVPNQPEQTTATPTIDQAAQQAEEQQRMRRRRGRQQYMVSQQGAAPTAGTKTLTGQ